MKPAEPIAKETVMRIHRMQIARHGGMGGLRDEGLLEAAIAQPWQGFGGVELYPSLVEKAARIGYEVVSQHPFNDGNKRTGAALVGALLRANGARFKPKADDYCRVILGVADGTLGYDDLLEFVKRSVG